MKKPYNLKKICAVLFAALLFILPLDACDVNSDMYISYTVTFDSQDGSEVSSLNSSTATGKVGRPADPYRSGYTFDNWYTSDTYDAIFNFDSVVTDAITLYAKWTVKNTDTSAPHLDIKNPPATAVELKAQFEAIKCVNVEIWDDNYWIIWGISMESFEGVQSVVHANKYDPDFYAEDFDYTKIDGNTKITEESAFVFYFNDAATAQNAFNSTKADIEKYYDDVETAIETAGLSISWSYSYMQNDKTISLYSIMSAKKGDWNFGF